MHANLAIFENSQHEKRSQMDGPYRMLRIILDSPRIFGGSTFDGHRCAFPPQEIHAKPTS